MIGIKSYAQEWTKIKSIPAPDGVGNVSLDRNGYFYVADMEGNIFKYDSNGTSQVVFSPLKKADVTVLDAWRNVNIFVYYRNFQEFIILDRFLNAAPNTRLDQGAIGFGRLATYSYDNNIWVIDETDFSVKKYNLNFAEVELNTPLDLLLDANLYDMNFMREYQNILFINDKNSGILLFDNMGNYKTKIPVLGLTYLGFYNDEIYYQQGNKVRFINIYDYKERFETIPTDKKYKFILYTGKRLMLFDEKSVELYKK